MKCLMCQGIGEITCTRCDGTGQAEYNDPQKPGTFKTGDCPACGGSSKRICPRCQGTGESRWTPVG